MINHTQTDPSPSLRYAYAFKLKRAFAYALICAEQFTKSTWRIIFWSIFFAGLWMLQIPGIFEQAGLIVTAFLFFAGLLYFLAVDMKRFNWPARAQIYRRLEIESGLRHRPLSEQGDRPVLSSTPHSFALWQIEQKRRQKDIARIKFIKWRTYLSAYDPYGLRLVAVLVFAAGIMVAGNEWNNRIIQGLIPLDWSGQNSQVPPVIVTITPPDYTKLGQIVLQKPSDVKQMIAIPEQSRIKILMSKAVVRPHITNQGDSRPLDLIEDGGYELQWLAQIPRHDTNYTSNGGKGADSNESTKAYHLAVKQFLFTNFAFDYTITPDTPPQIALQPLTEQEINNIKQQRKKQAEWAGMKKQMEDFIRQEEEFYTPENKKEKEPQGDTKGNQGSAEHQDPPDNADIAGNAKNETGTETTTKEAESELAQAAPAPIKREPKILSDGQIQIPLSVKDDYGVKTLSMRMTLSPDITDPPLGSGVQQDRSVMSPAGQDFKLSPVYDFTNHPWAGLPVEIKLRVTDFIGQTADLTPISLTLPERDFKHPVARQLVSLRKEIAWAPVAAAPKVQYQLEQLLAYPQDFQNDLVVYLAIKTAAARLHYSAGSQSIMHEDSRAVMALLWDAALRIEGGDLSIAARTLRYAQMALETALRNPELGQDEITSLMSELRQAMGAYLQEFQKELQKQFSEGKNLLLTPDALAELMSPEDLAQFLGKMENEMRDGNNQRAQGMLSQLQRMLDMLNPNMTLPLPEDVQFMADSVSDLQQLIDNQTALLEQTEEQKQDMDAQTKEATGFGNLLPQNSDLFLQWGIGDLPPPPSAKDHSNKKTIQDMHLNHNEQQALRYVLGQLMLESDTYMGKIPEKMGLAEREMYFSADDLQESLPGESIPHQELAIEYLKQAQQEMQEDLAKRIEQMTGGDQNSMPGGKQPFGGLGDKFAQGQGQRYDPLGRPLEGGQGGSDQNGYPDSNVKIPDEAERKRVEEILRTLRERSGELFRPREELEYFRRLLRQF